MTYTSITVPRPRDGRPAWWFAPSATRRVTRAFWHRRGGRLWLFGGCLFWLVVIYVWAAVMAVWAAAWAAVIAVVWTVQLAVLVVALPVAGARRLAR